ncbi:MAG: glyceraldehyde-3-phosphate dehydrogenase [Cellvibrionales bacterium TMED148]|nr:glyceraldehyde-3-phosphate dehydrogenase [Porticoccaceae bacterium]RPG88287.1 MAG: glyceraldehyde-3-phosphate dehydrogenase [Cellvibrionales bacterium TMED148]
MIEEHRPLPDDFFRDWKEREALAEGMIPLIGALYREKNVSTYMYGSNMVNMSVIDLMKAHRFVRQVESNELSEFETYPMLEAMSKLQIGPAHIDIGKMVVSYQELSGQKTIEEFLDIVLAEIIGSDFKPLPRPRDVVLYGFGRIGRLITRLLIDKAGGGDVMRLRAIVIRPGDAANDLMKRAALLRQDSVHGSFKGTIRVLEGQDILVVNGNPIKIIYADSPSEVDYTIHGIRDAIVIDNTGAWRDSEGLRGHLRPGASKVILTAPAGGDIPNVVYGINHHEISPKSSIVSAASCTTNAIVPVLKVMSDEFGIEYGHVETVHAYTNDQNLIDNYHKGDRRGRSAPLNMVLTSTGAAKAVAKAIPELEGRLTGNAIRVPTPNVSMALLHLQLKTSTDREKLNEFMRRTALYSDLQQQIGYTLSTEAVSTDFVGSRQACVFDSEATIVKDKNCVLYCWYDNEFGYSCQVVRCLETMAGVTWKRFPKGI